MDQQLSLAHRVKSGLAARSTITPDMHTLNDCETVEVKLPRGPAAFCTPRINGRPPKNSIFSKKSYTLAVEPKATFVKRTRANMHHRSATEGKSNEDLDTGTVSGLEAAEISPALGSAIRKREHYYERARFRQERAQRFGRERLFPVLVTPKLLPQWQENERPESTDVDGGGGAGPSDRDSTVTPTSSALPMSERRRARQRLQQPTLILAVRQGPRPVIQEPTRKWHTHVEVQDLKRQLSRSPVLYDEEYNPPSSMTMRTRREDCWVADDFRLPSISGAKAAIEFNGPRIEQEIAESRAKGHRNRDKLEVRLESRLEAYKREQEERGPLSNFALRELALLRKDQDAAHTHRSAGSSESEPTDFAERMSIGFSRYRMSRMQLPTE